MHDSEYDRLINNKWLSAGLMDSGRILPSDKQAMAGCRALYRKATGRPFKGKVKIVRRKNQYTWLRNGILVVNPNRPDDWDRTGWPDMVHLMSHLCHHILRPSERPHSRAQLELEKNLTNYALSPVFEKYIY